MSMERLPEYCKECGELPDGAVVFRGSKKMPHTKLAGESQYKKCPVPLCSCVLISCLLLSLAKTTFRQRANESMDPVHIHQLEKSGY